MMLSLLFSRRWSTLTLLAVCGGVGVCAYRGGREAKSREITSTSLRSEKTPRPLVEFGSAAKRIDPPLAVTARRTAGTEESAERWRELSSVSRTPASERELAAFLTELARHDAQQAMAFALAESNLRLRETLRNAALRGWAATAANDAAAWAIALPRMERSTALEAVFAGAAIVPDDAVRLGARLCAENPALASDYGQFLISALNEAGAYEAALRFAVADASSNRTAWLTAASYEWAAHQPTIALAACNALGDVEARQAAFQGAAAGWALADPSGLASYAMTLPSGEDRAHALAQALPRWVSMDPIAASKWIANFDPNPDLDAGAAAVATLPLMLNQRPEIAANWAENIAEPTLRANTLGTVAKQWAKKDPDAVRRFILSRPNLSEGDRARLTDALNPPPDA